MIVAIIRLAGVSPPDELIEALGEAGITHAEVTLPTPEALALIRRWASHTDIAVGAGTVRDRGGAVAARDAGARFFVTPTLDNQVLEVAAGASVPVFAGALTPTEIEVAYRHRAVQAVKVFPAAPIGGPAYIKAIKDPLPDVPLLPTGGVGVEEATAYARLGCVGVGVGGSLVSEADVAAKNWSAIQQRARALVEAWALGSS